jgi:hypothetical protein
MRKLAESVFFFLIAVAFATGILVAVVKYPWAKEVAYKEGDCLKMDFPGVEAWHYGMIARVDTIGKQNYGVKYWLEYGWSTYTDTWPFSLSVVKVACPQENHNDETK